jgi:hypothetical protein
MTHLGHERHRGYVKPSSQPSTGSFAKRGGGFDSETRSRPPCLGCVSELDDPGVSEGITIDLAVHPGDGLGLQPQIECFRPQDRNAINGEALGGEGDRLN